jgi:hypothetical protein
MRASRASVASRARERRRSSNAFATPMPPRFPINARDNSMATAS